jgi:uncharacterized membrane protein YccC
MSSVCYAGIMPQFTTETAREAQRQSAIKRRANRIASRQEGPCQPANQPAKEPDTHPFARLARVRTQLDGVDDALALELKRGDKLDAQKLDRLAAASSRLEEQERRLSGRSLPAVRRDNGKHWAGLSVLGEGAGRLDMGL